MIDKQEHTENEQDVDLYEEYLSGYFDEYPWDETDDIHHDLGWDFDYF